MKLLRSSTCFTALQKGSVVTLGNFDGVHLGHQALLRRLKQQAQALNLPLVVLIFEPQPAEFFQKDKAPIRLCSLREKLTQLALCQVDYVYCLKFNSHLAAMQAEDFAHTYLFSLLQAKYILVGEDFRFGHQRLGDVHTLKQWGKAQACEVAVFNEVKAMDQRISSTAIRQTLSQDNLAYASQLLGHPFSLCGRVVFGDGRGKQWGIPTANINIADRIVPLKGVYCVQVIYKEQCFPGVANVGNRPTVDGCKTFLEVHLLDVDIPLYGEWLQVCFLHKLREEKKFSAVDALILQIQKDISRTKLFFEGNISC